MLRLRRDHQDMTEVYGVDDDEKVEGGEERAAPDAEEAEQVQGFPIPDAPTLSDVLPHHATHYPYRPWCPDCAEGRGREFWHFACQPREGRSIPTVSFKYCFIGDRPASFVACTFTTTTTTTTTTLRMCTCNCLYVYPAAGPRSLRVSCWTARSCRVRTHPRMSSSRPPVVLLCFDVYLCRYSLLCRQNCF